MKVSVKSTGTISMDSLCSRLVGRSSTDYGKGNIMLNKNVNLLEGNRKYNSAQKENGVVESSEQNNRLLYGRKE